MTNNRYDECMQAAGLLVEDQLPMLAEPVIHVAGVAVDTREQELDFYSVPVSQC